MIYPTGDWPVSLKNTLIKAFTISGIIMVFLLTTHSGFAAELLMARSTQDFPEAMSTLQNAITQRGYKVTRVQRVDEGLKKLGYKSDKYRVVFYGKASEIRKISNKFPTLIPYIPLNFVIFAEGKETLISTLNPSDLKPYYPNPEIAIVFDRWEKDIRKILADVRNTK